MKALVLCLLWPATFATAAIVDTLTFGDASSEKSHKLTAERSDVIRGGLGEPARRLLPAEPESWEGGRVAFTLKVHPLQPNYFSVRLWGSDANDNQLILFCEGKQIGYRHLGDIDLLDHGSDAPAFNGRFYYTTTPLPVELTRGKTTLNLEIRSIGRTWGYGTTFEQYQKPMTEPTRGIYRVYTHTDGYFVPPADEKQGAVPRDVPVRPAPGAEVLDQIKERVNKQLDALLTSDKPVSQMQMQLLAKAYDVKWTRAYQNPRTVEQILNSLDALFSAYRQNPKLAQAEPSTWNPDWFGLGVCGQVIALRYEQLKPSLTDQRRADYTEMLVATRDWHRQHRRQYTNQSMLNDLNGIYHANRGLAVLDPPKALPETDARRYLYEAVGLEPWRGNTRVGDNYMQLTAKGLSKELGYVGSYGEIIDLVADIYDATHDDRIKAQLVKIARARSVFRHPALDADGNRAMRLEQVIGWRDSNYPGYLTYAQRATRDASALQAAALTLDPHLVGYAQQMIADNQFFASEVEAMNDRAQPLRTTIGRLESPDQYELIRSQPASDARLPMTPGQPDFIFTDEEDGVVAVKHRDEIFYTSLYWRARYGINNLARVHYITPRFDRIAVVRQDTKFEPSGEFYTRPDWINFGFGNGGPKYPVELHSAHAGEKLPIAKIPDGIEFRPGNENVHAGKGQFYTLRYGPYTIGMNTTTNQTFELDGRKVGPRSTLVLRKDK
jgi:hypothetical protein